MPDFRCQMGDVMSTSRIEFLNRSSKIGRYYKQFWNHRFWTGMLLLLISTCTSWHTKRYMRRQADFILARLVPVQHLRTKLPNASLSLSDNILLIVVHVPLLIHSLISRKGCWWSDVMELDKSLFLLLILVLVSRRSFSLFVLIVLLVHHFSFSLFALCLRHTANKNEASAVSSLFLSVFTVSIGHHIVLNRVTPIQEMGVIPESVGLFRNFRSYFEPWTAYKNDRFRTKNEISIFSVKTMTWHPESGIPEPLI